MGTKKYQKSHLNQPDNEQRENRGSPHRPSAPSHSARGHGTETAGRLRLGVQKRAAVPPGFLGMWNQGGSSSPQKRLPLGSKTQDAKVLPLPPW